MKVLLDTNIILDCLLERYPHFTHSKEVLRQCLDGGVSGYMATHTVNDIFFVAHKNKPELPPENLVKAIVIFTKMLETVNLTAADVEAASFLRLSDFEDALINQCASKIKADYIVTRNIKNFGNSTVTAITPQEFLDLI
ncbi:MAG: PIN domain-containing protein [Oscillospiraceae bacterium]|nr:PIN domain-containing protein [Oscillospiraceae bacterium]